MAILVEEEKKTSNSPAIFGWLIIFVVILVAAYYIFFAPPPAVTVAPPPNFQTIAPIAQINFNPTALVNGAAFQSLKQYIPEPTSTGPIPVGRANPFIP